MPRPLLIEDVVAVWHELRQTRSRLEKRRRLVELLSEGRGADATRAADFAAAACWLAGEIPQGALGVGWRAWAAALRRQPPAELPLFAGRQSSPSPPPPVAVTELAGAFDRLAAIAGPGAGAERVDVLGALVLRMQPEERQFLEGLILGELRQGALRSLAVDAVHVAFDVPLEELRRAVMFAGSLYEVIAAVAVHGAAATAAFQPRLLIPVEPMLAAPAPDVATAVEELPPCAIEWKLDGVRIQVHRDGEMVRVFSRQLRDVTALVPGIVDAVRALPAAQFILDGELVSTGASGRPLPFQDLFSRFAGPADQAGGPPLEALFFDVLHAGGRPKVDEPYCNRRRILESIVPEHMRVPAWDVADVAGAQTRFADALARGYEGVMIKALDSTYAAGRRGAMWRKVKPAVTADLVVLAAEWGHGRRHGWLSNLHLGARMPAGKAGEARYAMLGKTFKGLTDAMLADLTARLTGLETHREGITVWVRPELVVEVAFDALQRSPRYESGFALRFARVKRLRFDKSAADATTLDEILASGTTPAGGIDDARHELRE